MSLLTSFNSEKLCVAVSTVEDDNLSYRWGEEAEVTKNRNRFLEKFGLHTKDLVVMEVQHEDKISIVSEDDKTKGREVVPAEALITKDKNCILFLLTADCLPIVIYDPTKEVVSLSHLGWKPTDRKLVQKVVKTMTSQFGSNPHELKVFIGPGIHKESYVFKDPLQKTLPPWAPFVTDLPSGDTQIDIVAYNEAQLREVGVSKTNITIDPTDTAISPDYFSHYRSVRTGEPEKRFATIVVLR